VAEIVELIVDDHSRGRSVGAQLVNAIMLLARDRGCCCLEVSSNRVRRRAHRFYARHGFMMTHYKLSMKMDFMAE
jgi:PhnO protein